MQERKNAFFLRNAPMESTHRELSIVMNAGIRANTDSLFTTMKNSYNVFFIVYDNEKFTQLNCCRILLQADQLLDIII